MRSFETDDLRADDAVTFSPDDRFFASADDWHLETPLTEWDLETGGRRFNPTSTHGLIDSIAFSKDGKCVASASSHLVKLWDAETRVHLWDLANFKESTWSRRISFSANGLYIDMENGRILAFSTGLSAWMPRVTQHRHDQVEVYENAALILGLTSN